MKKMNMYEAPVAEMIEIEVSNMMMTSQTGPNNGGQGSQISGGSGNPTSWP
jgi:hypothetical protein